MMIALGLVMMAAGLWVATRLGSASRLAHRAGSAVAAGTGVLLVMADTVRPDLTPLAVAALCISLLWLALAPPPVRVARSKEEVPR